MIELPGFEEIVDNQIFVENSDEGNLIVLSKFCELLPRDTFNYLIEKASDLSALTLAGNEPATELEKLLVQLPESYKKALITNNLYFFESHQLYLFGHVTDEPDIFLQIDYWKISPEDLGMLNNNPPYIESLLSDSHASENGFGRQWNLRLRADEDGFLPPEKKVEFLVMDRVSLSKTLKVMPENYSRREVIKVMKAIYQGWQPEAFDELSFELDKHLEELAVLSLKDTLAGFGQEEPARLPPFFKLSQN